MEMMGIMGGKRLLWVPDGVLSQRHFASSAAVLRSTAFVPLSLFSPPSMGLGSLLGSRHSTALL